MPLFYVESGYHKQTGPTFSFIID